ncbi:hypothetical protein GCM10009738_64870 [Kitasatospora viridis]
MAAGHYQVEPKFAVASEVCLNHRGVCQEFDDARTSVRIVQRECIEQLDQGCDRTP